MICELESRVLCGLDREVQSSDFFVHFLCIFGRVKVMMDCTFGIEL